jgi:glycosyltransferase involved in cell wall biosynthesis
MGSSDGALSRVSYISPEFSPASSAVAVRSGFLADKLLSEGLRVRLWGKRGAIEGAEFRKILMPLPGNRDRALPRLFKELLYGTELFVRILFAPRDDLYIVTTPPFFAALFTCAAIRLKGGRYLLDVRDLYPEVFFVTGLLGRGSFGGRLLQKAAGWMYAEAWQVVTVTHGLAERISRSLPAAKGTEVSIVYNGYDGELFLPSEKKYDRFTVVIHGTLGRFQDIGLLAETLRRLERDGERDLRILVMGKGPKERLLAPVASESALMDFQGTVEHREVPDRIGRAHIGLSLLTDDEIGRTALPVKVFEYLGAGIPVIVTPVNSEVEALVESRRLGLAVRNRPEELATAIETIRSDYESYVANVLKYREDFDRKRAAEHFYAIITKRMKEEREKTNAEK